MVIRELLEDQHDFYTKNKKIYFGVLSRPRVGFASVKYLIHSIIVGCVLRGFEKVPRYEQTSTNR